MKDRPTCPEDLRDRKVSGEDLTGELCEAALRGDLASAEWLLANGANPNESMPADELQKEDGITENAIYFAVRSGNIDVFDYLQKAGATWHHDYALYICASYGHLEMLAFVMKERNLSLSGKDSVEVNNSFSVPSSLLGLATQNGHIDVMKWLIRQGVNPRACWPEENLLFSAALTGSARLFQFIVEIGFDPATDGRVRPDFFNGGWVADLLEAAIRGCRVNNLPDLELVETILEAGYSPLDEGIQGSKTEDGSATHIESAIKKRYPPLIDLMIRALPAPETLTREQSVRLHEAAKHSDLVMVKLQQAGFCKE